MARHLLIGDGTTSAMANGVEAAGAINIQKLSATGPTDLVAGDSIADSDSIRFLQGTSGNNIVSPWVKGRNIISFTGKSYSAPVSQSSTITWSADATNTSDVEVTIKLINTSNGQADPFDAKSYTVTTNASAIDTQAEIGDNFAGAMKASYSISGSLALTTTQSDELPWFVKSVAWDASTVITLVGWDKGETMQNGQVAEYATSFDIVVENGDAAANGGVLAVATGTVADEGYGYGEYVYQLESDLMGINYGYYNRIHLPVAPTSTASKTATYDLYHIAATKDGSTTSSINGVDNLIEINIAMPAGDADGLVFQGKLNPWMNSAGFGSINL